MQRRWPTAFTALAVATAVSVSGCGGGSNGSTPANPKDELVASIANVSHTDTLTTTISLDTSSAALRAYARSQGQQLSAADADTITSARLVFEAKTNGGQDLSESRSGDGTNIAITGSSRGQTLLELRIVNGDAYLRGDIRGVLALAHKSRLFTEVKARAATLPDFVGAFVSGKWVSLSGAAATGLLGTFGGTPSGSDQSQAAQLTNDLRGVVERDVSVRKVGTDSNGDHLQISAHSRKLAADVMQTVGSDLPGGSLALSKANPSNMRDRLVTLDAWVKDGVLTRISLDLAQFSHGRSSGHLPFTIAFEQSGGDITRPSGATPIDLTKLSTLAGALSS